MTPIADVVLDSSFRVGPVPRRLFGSFVEHMGRCVYGGIHEPEHPTADEDGFRGDVLELTRELGATVIRYPGGNFVSGYRWEDGVGPRNERPVRLERAWKALETNQVGTDEFLGWARRLGAEPMMAVNLGTRGMQEACELLEYCNFPSGTALSDLRIKNGTREPHDVRLWCLGNEMDGPWQMGHKSAAEYGRLAAETARGMRRLDPDIELVACGSSHSRMATFGAWEAEVLEHTYELVDHVSLHAYYQEHDGDTASFLASAADMDRQIEAVVATADAVGARLRSRKKLTLSFDEWNVWYQSRFVGENAMAFPEAGSTPRPLIEDNYSALDAVVVGDLMLSLLRHADRVAIACQAQLVNVIAPIRTEPGGPAWRQSIFDPFALTARHARGQVLRAAVTAPVLSTKRHDDVDQLAVSATLDEESGELAVFMVNRSPQEVLPARVRLPRGSWRPVAHEGIASDGTTRANSAGEPDAVRVGGRPLPTVADGSVELELPAASWTVLRFAAER
ncbi:arabinosylfuranosidase ArfA [Pseudonocardia sp. TRM90224]|uniref:arabinosylfuranosidase ArfA n=1 Tax=Pseudonocardia sp. TRM90224 TaxID=2812678 RepID=UPI001E285CF7|nr:alpha-N-arabinofuranosidase [Pseudonocardia sp. TRM90224]